MKRFLIILTAISIAAFSISGCGSKRTEEDKRVEKELKEMAQKYNDQAPFMINETTQLDSISILPNRTMQYNLTMINLLKEETDIEYFEEQKLVVANQLKSSLPENARQDKVTFIYSYNDKDGNFVHKIVISPDMYQ